jgi:hypothetical protein
LGIDADCEQKVKDGLKIFRQIKQLNCVNDAFLIILWMMKYLTLTLSFILLSLSSFAQISIKGRVISQTDTKPVANASVFLSNATIGDHTAVDGTFTLTNVKPGQYNLIVSIIGFDTYNQTVTINQNSIDLQTIIIYPKSITLSEVKIKPTVDFDRQRNYDWFKDEFLGKTDLARDCKILNPEILDLEYNERTGILTASSDDFLVIQNNALGFKIKYLLKDFTLNNADEFDKTISYSGAVLFELLSGKPNEQRQWQRKRAEVYRGSVVHFLRSALNDKLDVEGFRILRLPANPERPDDVVIDEKIRTFAELKNNPNARDSLAFWKKKSGLPKRMQKLLPAPLKKEEFVTGPDERGLYTLSNVNQTQANINDALYVTYDRNHSFSRSTINKLSDPENKDNTLVIFDTSKVLFDKNGNVIDPKSLTYDGVWSRNRMAGMLPLDYEPNENKNAPEADSTLIKNISTKLNNYTASHVTEKAYLHFDKPFYAAGDTMYFRACITTGEKHEPSTQSGVLYADLIGPDNKISHSIQLQVKQGTAWGDFALADTLKNGNYRVRAYTQLMRNGNEYYDQSIAVGSINSNRVPESGRAVKENNNFNPVTGFLPEGGSLVTGIKSKIAFKAIAINGSGIEVKGTVLDNNGKEITNFTTVHLGMGYFYLTPMEGKTYRAKLSYADGKQDIVELPRSKDNGICMEVTGENRSYSIRVSCSKLYYQNNKNKLFTLITYSGGVPLGLSFKLDKPEVVETFSKKDLRMGIAKATLFSADEEPLCERLMFVQNDDLLKIDVSSDKAVYNKREKTSIQLKISNGSEPAAGNYSVSVTDEDKIKIDEAAEPTIINYLLLTSELKGYIEQPNYYFNNINDKTAADLDLVMLTHGYRSFEWKKILTNGTNNEKQVAYPPKKGLAIAGYIKLKGKAVPNAKVRLFTKGKSGIMLDTTANENGRFVFDNMGFDDTTKFVLQARTAKGEKDVDVEVDKQTTAPQVPIGLTPEGQKDDYSFAAYLQSNKQFYEEQKKYGINQHALVLKEVIEVHIAHSDNLNGNGAADQIITAKDLESLPCSRLIDCLQAKLFGIVFSDGMLFVKRLQNTDPTKTSLYDTPMAIVVDGTVVDYNVLHSLNSNDIEGIEVLMGPHFAAIYGSRAVGGALIITTKRAKKINNYYREAPGVIVYTARGFYKAREFYSPQYDNPRTNPKMADLRSTIYWNPNINTDKDGKASFEYFNADGKGTYRVVVEGIDADGNLGRQVFRYKVE